LENSFPFTHSLKADRSSVRFPDARLIYELHSHFKREANKEH